MEFTIGDRVYKDGRQNLFAILELKKQTGLTIDDLQSGRDYLSSFENPEAVMSDERGLLLMGASIWFVRMNNGDWISFEESMKTPLDDITFIQDEDDAEPEEEPDPTGSALPDGAAAEADEPEDVVPVAV